MCHSARRMLCISDFCVSMQNKSGTVFLIFQSTCETQYLTTSCLLINRAFWVFLQRFRDFSLKFPKLFFKVSENFRWSLLKLFLKCTHGNTEGVIWLITKAQSCRFVVLTDCISTNYLSISAFFGILTTFWTMVLNFISRYLTPQKSEFTSVFFKTKYLTCRTRK